MFVVRLATKGVAAGIGLASEAVADHKERKQARQHVGPISPSGSLSPQPQVSHDKQVHDDEKHIHNDSDSPESDEESLDHDKALQALDEAANELASPPAYEEHTPSSADELATRFIQTHKLQPAKTHQPLALPVILPQRRPKNRTRGFVRAYAPVLGECSGIDQQTFLDFLTEFDHSTRASPVFDIINLACFGVGMIPNPIALGVSIAVQVAANTAKEVQTRYRTNTFLNQINETLFKPRGLYCMILTYKPDSPFDPVVGMNINTADMALTKYASSSSSGSDLHAKLKKLRLSSGTTHGDFVLPESAPLIYPAIDALTSQDPSQLPTQKQNALKSAAAFLPAYLDRRAQAVFTDSHQNSKLQYAPPEKQFASRFSDPNHPVNSGSWVALLTGGKVNPMAEKRVRKAKRRAAKRGIVLTEQDLHNAAQGRRLRQKKGLMSRAMHKDVIYLTVVNLPSEAEMQEMRQELERLTKEQQNHPAYLSPYASQVDPMVTRGGSRSRSREARRTSQGYFDDSDRRY